MRCRLSERAMIGVSLALMTFGLLTLYSAGQTDVPTQATGVWYRELVWFGIGEASKVVLIVYTTAFGVLLNTVAGVAAVSRNKVRVAQCFGASRRQIFFSVTLPATTRYILTGMRLSMTNAFLVIVAAEMVQADSGLGFAIMAARQFLAPDLIFCGMITLGLLGLIADRLLLFVSHTVFGRYYRQN